MDLARDHSAHGRRPSAQRHLGPRRAALRGMAAVPRMGPLADHRIRLDTTTPVGTIAKSQKTGTVTFIVLRSGSADLGRWVTERRNVAADYQTIFGEPPEDPRAITIS